MLTSLIVLGARSLRMKSIAIKILSLKFDRFLNIALVCQKWESATLLLLNLSSLKVISAVEVLDELFLLFHEYLLLEFKPRGGTLTTVRRSIRLVHIKSGDLFYNSIAASRWYSQAIGDLSLLLIIIFFSVI